MHASRPDSRVRIIRLTILAQVTYMLLGDGAYSTNPRHMHSRTSMESMFPYVRESNDIVHMYSNRDFTGFHVSTHVRPHT